jgi:hypothetical protein
MTWPHVNVFAFVPGMAAIGLGLGVATLGTLFISTEPRHIAGGFGWVIGISAAVAVFVAIGSFALPRLPDTPSPASTVTALEC